MIAENHAALRYILADEVYLLPADRVAEAVAVVADDEKGTTTEAVVPAVKVQEVAAVIAAPEVPLEPKEESKMPNPEQVAGPVAVVNEAKLTERTPQFIALGSNQKNILVLVNYPGKEFMEEAHLQALENAFGRLGHTRNDFAILNIASYPGVMFEQLSGFYKPQTLLLMGADSYPAGLPQQPFNLLREGKGGRKLLSTYSFTEMMGDKEKTRAFWEQMKNL